MVRGHLGSRLEHLKPPRPAGIFFSLCGIGAWGAAGRWGKVAAAAAAAAVEILEHPRRVADE